MTQASDHRAYFFKIDTTIKKIRSALQKQFNEAGFDLTVDQWVLIDHIARNQGISQNGLAELTAKDAPTITRILDLLTKKKLAEKQLSQEDRRRFDVFLTPAGLAKFKQVLPVVVELRRRGWNDLSDEDYAHFVRIMDSIYQNFSE